MVNLLTLRLGAFGVECEPLADRDFCMSTAEDFDDAKQPESENRQVALRNDVNETKGEVAALLGQSGPQQVHNIKGDKLHVWRMLTLGENKAEPLTSIVNGDPIEVTNWYLKKVEIEDAATGEIQEPIRTVLYTADGKIYACTSVGIAKSMAGIIEVFGVGPYNPPIKVEVMEVTTAKKRKMLTLIPAG